ncbi:carboxymuconolactone decarboxylase family protein [Nocardioides sp.]|uniref:carboxymuconolactone decarboxylase family protein n=1 Tax=Nocardioides sp. TaxID=35761 RepID=UPI002ED5FA7F
MDHAERLTLLAMSDPAHGERCLSGLAGSEALDPKTRSLVRLAAMMAVGGAVPSYGALADAAISSGARPAEIVDVLESIVPVIGLPCAVAAAHRVSLALGYDTETDWDRRLEI